MASSSDARGPAAPSLARGGAAAPLTAREPSGPGAPAGAGAKGTPAARGASAKASASAARGASARAGGAASCVACAPGGGEAFDGAGGALSIREVAAVTGVTAHTLRYYERAGLLPSVPRAASGHRRYGPREVRWVTFLRRLHETGMPIRRMLEYARLARRGDATAAERRALLVAHRREVEARQRGLAENMALIKKKIRSYEAIERQRRAAEGAGR